MNAVSLFFVRVFSFLKNLFAPKKIVLANQEAINKMEEINNSNTNTRIAALEKQIAQLSFDLKTVLEMEKTSQEFLLYLCTTNEELLNTISESEEAIESLNASEEERLEEDFLNSQWNIKKGGNSLN